MTLYYAEGSATAEISDEQMREALHGVLAQIGQRTKVLALPPDFTRYNSRAGQLICMAYEFYGSAMTDIMPALGTHVPMPCLLYTSPSPRDAHESRMPSSA